MPLPRHLRDGLDLYLLFFRVTPRELACYSSEARQLPPREARAVLGWVLRSRQGGALLSELRAWLSAAALNERELENLIWHQLQRSWLGLTLWQLPRQIVGGGRAESVDGSVDEGVGEGQGPALDWIELRVVDERGEPVAGVPYRFVLADDRVRQGRSNSQGLVRLDGIPAGSCQFTVPDADQSFWTLK